MHLFLINYHPEVQVQSKTKHNAISAKRNNEEPTMPAHSTDTDIYIIRSTGTAYVDLRCGTVSVAEP
jgi:hypothetical protein